LPASKLPRNDRERIAGLLYDYVRKGDVGRARALAKLRKHLNLATITFSRQGIMWSFAISDEAMAELFHLARPLNPRDRTLFVEDVVAELDGHTEIDAGLVSRVAGPLQRSYLGFVRGTGTARYR
jgi:hypothetical protein